MISTNPQWNKLKEHIKEKEQLCFKLAKEEKGKRYLDDAHYFTMILTKMDELKKEAAP